MKSSRQPRAVWVCGGPATGKSTIAESAVLPIGFELIDADAPLQELVESYRPELGDGGGRDVSPAAARRLAEDLVRRLRSEVAEGPRPSSGPPRDAGPSPERRPMSDWDDPRDFLAGRRPLNRGHLKAVAEEITRRRLAVARRKRENLLFVETGGRTGRLIRLRRTLEDEGYETLLVWVYVRELATVRRRNRARREGRGRGLPAPALESSLAAARRGRRTLLEAFRPRVLEIDNSADGDEALGRKTAELRAAVGAWIAGRRLPDAGVRPPPAGADGVTAMVEVGRRVYVGPLDQCFRGAGEWAVVHVGKHSCPHPNLLMADKANNLFLDMADSSEPDFPKELFLEFLEFARRHWDAGRKVLIHCRQGRSRSPSLALLFLAKHAGQLSDRSFDAAREELSAVLPEYSPAAGIRRYLREHWAELELRALESTR